MPRKRHPKWQYTDTGPGRMEDAFPGVQSVQEIEEMHFLAWSPDPEPGRGKATQVHVVYRLKGTNQIAFTQRFKTVEALDAFIRLLAEYRRHVWGTQDSR